MSNAAIAREIQGVSIYSNQGNRSIQEDYSLADREKKIFVVADGFGGPVAGSRASQTACEAVKAFLEREAGDLDATLPFVLRTYYSLAANVLFNAVIHANRELIKLNIGKGVHERGGASVVAAFLDGEFLALANVGCCTAWLFRNGKAARLVVPRSYGRVLDPFSEDENSESALRVPLMSLGTAEDLEPEMIELRIEPGDWLLLATDGLSSQTRQELGRIQTAVKAQEAAEQALGILNSSEKSDDNIAISLVIF